MTTPKTKPKSPSITCIMRGIIHDGQTAWVRETDHVGTVEQGTKRILALAQEHPGTAFRIARLWPGHETKEVTTMVTRVVPHMPLADEAAPATAHDTAPATAAQSVESVLACTRDHHEEDAHAEDDFGNLF